MTEPTWCLVQCERCGVWSSYQAAAPAVQRPCHICACSSWRHVKFPEGEGETASRHVLGYYRQRMIDKPVQGAWQTLTNT